MPRKPRVVTVLLGQFEHPRAEALIKELDAAGIVWWQKQAGGIAQFLFRGDWGVRLFVDRARIDEVRDVVARVDERLGGAR